MPQLRRNVIDPVALGHTNTYRRIRARATSAAHPAVPTDWPATERAWSYYVAFRDAAVAKPFAAVKTSRCVLGGTAVAATPSFAIVALIGKGYLVRKLLFGLIGSISRELLLLLTVVTEYDSFAAPA